MTKEPDREGEGARYSVLRQFLGGLRQAVTTGGGKAEAGGYVLEAVLEAGVPAVVILTTLLYSTHLSDYRIGKIATVHAMVALLLGIWLAKFALQGRLSLERLPLLRPVLAYLVVALVALAFSHNLAQGAEVVLFQVWLFLFFILISHHFRHPAAASSILWAVVLTGLVVALLGLLQYSDVQLIPRPENFGTMPVSTLGNLNFVAHYLEIVIPLTMVMMAIRTRLWERLVLGCAFLVASSHLVLTTSRAGWLATGVGLLFWLGMARRKVRWLPFAIPVVVAGALLSPVIALVLESIHLGSSESLYHRTAVVAEQTWERMLSSLDQRDFSISQRLLIWRDTLSLIRTHPLLGVGPGNYELALPAARTAASQRAWRELVGQSTSVPYHAHNEYLEFWAESGVLGLGAMLWLLGSLLWVGWRYLQNQSRDAVRMVTLGCMAGLIATLVHSFFSFNLQDPTSALHFWLLAGLMVAVNRTGRANEIFALTIRLHSVRRRLLLAAAGAAVGLIGLYMGLSILLGDLHYSQGMKKFLRDGHPNRASLEFREAIAWRGCDFRYYHALGEVSLAAERYAQAEAALKQSLARHPHNPPALRLLGRALLARQKGEEAIRVLKRAIALDPLERRTYELLALAYRQQGMHARAVEAWKQALAFWPEDVRLLNSLGNEYWYAGQAAEAVAVLERAAGLQPRDASIQGSLGGVYWRAGKLAEAEAALLKAIELMPDEVGWRSNLVGVYQQQRRWDEALLQAEMILRIDPRNEPFQLLVQDLRRRLEEGRR